MIRVFIFKCELILDFEYNTAWNQYIFILSSELIYILSQAKTHKNMSSTSKFILTLVQGLAKEEPSFPTLPKEHEQLQKPQYPELEESKR